MRPYAHDPCHIHFKLWYTRPTNSRILCVDSWHFGQGQPVAVKPACDQNVVCKFNLGDSPQHPPDAVRLWPCCVFWSVTFDFLLQSLSFLVSRWLWVSPDILHRWQYVPPTEKRIYVAKSPWFFQRRDYCTIHLFPVGVSDSMLDMPVLQRTWQTSRRYSEFSIITLSIGSWISHSWNAAVSFVIVRPLKICDSLVRDE